MTRSTSVPVRAQPSAPDAPHEMPTLPWHELVAAKVSALKYGVVQIVVHDSRVVQVESTERFRFEVPRAS